jgi:hypothetical protein
LPVEEFLISLTADDRIRVRMDLRQGQPIEMTVQFEGFIRDRWVPMRRYGTAHGYLHVHSAPWDDELDRTIVVPHGGLKAAITDAIQDIKANWPRYREACVIALEGEAR